MKDLGLVIEDFLRGKEMWNQYKRYLMIECWEKVVGREIAAVTRASRINEGRLWVEVKDSTWAYHLSLLKPQLLQKINTHTGDKGVQDIYFQVGVLNRQENIPGKLNNNTDEDNSTVSRAKADSSFVEGIRRIKKMELFQKTEDLNQKGG